MSAIFSMKILKYVDNFSISIGELSSDFQSQILDIKVLMIDETNDFGDKFMITKDIMLGPIFKTTEIKQAEQHYSLNFFIWIHHDQFGRSCY